jgi:uncharacterized protein YecE (DUF72 family)
VAHRSKRPRDQLSLFGEEPPPDVLADEYASAAELAKALPPSLYLGTSSWGFPGWYGIVYSERQSEQALAREGLREYAQHPLLRTVGIDRSFYAPIPETDLDRYAGQLPPGFPCCAKALARITSPINMGLGPGVEGEPNPDFLSPSLFMDLMGQPFLERFRDHLGPFIFEFPPVAPELRPSPEAFAERLDRFFSALPRSLPYCVELRDRALMTPAYRQVLAAHGVAHAYNYWRAMPMPAAQARHLPLGAAPFVLIRLMLRPGTQYEERRHLFAPFNRIVDPDEQMRREVVDLIRTAQAAGRPTYVLVNNKAEGSSPLTVRALAEQLSRRP